MIITICGNNAHELKRRLGQLTNDFISQHGELAVEKLDGEEIEPQAVIDAAQSLPFLAQKKLIVVRSLGANKQAADNIEQILSSVGASTDLIFYEPSIDKRTVYFKVLKKQTELEEYSQKEPDQLATWLVEEAKNQSAELSSVDARYLIERVGDDQSLLFNELEKLITYDPKITKQNIELLTEKTPQSRVFDLLDAAFGGSKKRALELYEEQRAQKVEPQAILAMMAWQLQLISLAKLGNGKPSAEIAKEAGLSPYPLSKAKNLASKLTDGALRDLINEAYKIDMLTKSKPIDLDEALKTYITTL